MERFTVATSHQLEVKASAQQAWDRLHDFENLHNVFSTVHAAECIGNPWTVGSKIKVTRLLPTKHCFLATYTIVRHDEDEEKMEFQFYSEDIASGAATISTTWKVDPLGEDNCMVTISIAVVPQKIIISAGRLVFAPFLKRLVKGTLKQDLKDLAASFENEPPAKGLITKPLRTSLRDHDLAGARKFQEPKREENSERTRSTIASFDDVPSISGHSSNTSRTSSTQLGRSSHSRQQEDFTSMRSTSNIRQVRWM